MNIRKTSKMMIAVIVLLIFLAVFEVSRAHRVPYTFFIEEEGLYVHFVEDSHRAYFGKSLEDITEGSDCIEVDIYDLSANFFDFYKSKKGDTLFFFNGHGSNYKIIKSTNFAVNTIEPWRDAVLVDSIRGFHKTIDEHTYFEENSHFYSSVVYNRKTWPWSSSSRVLYYRSHCEDEQVVSIRELRK